MTNPSSLKIFHTICQHLNLAIMNTQFFFNDHPEVKGQIDQLYSQRSKLPEKLTIVWFENILILNKKRISERNSVIENFIKLLQTNSIESITFSPGISMSELTRFITSMALAKESFKWTGSSITLGKITGRKENKEIDASEPGTDINHPSEKQNILHLSEDDNPEFRASRIFSNLDRIKEVFKDLPDNKDINQIKKLAKSIHYFVKGFTYGINHMEYLGAIKSYDEYTFVHVTNVFMLTMCQAESLGFSGELLYNIGVAAALHDIGKLFIPSEIINKPGILTQKEKNIIKMHTIEGSRFIMEIGDITKLAALSAMDHHIRFDGSGYPKIKKDWKPNIVSQMICISDAFDAMRSNRPYQEAKPQELIIKILKEESGTSFNPFLVNNFVSLLEDKPVKAKDTF